MFKLMDFKDKLSDQEDQVHYPFFKKQRFPLKLISSWSISYYGKSYSIDCFICILGRHP